MKTLSLSLAVSTLIVLPSFGDTHMWTGAGGILNKKWSNGANWSSLAAPAPGDTLVFRSTNGNKDTSNDYEPGTDFTQIGIDESNFTLAGNPFDLTMAEAVGYSLDVVYDSGTTTVSSGGIGLQNNDQKWRVGASGQRARVIASAPIDLNGHRLTAYVEGLLYANGVISDSAAIPALRKEGAGPMFLNAANTYTGTTEVLHGKLVVDGSTAGGGVSVGANGEINGGGSIGGSLTCDGAISPGYSATTGVLTIMGSLSLDAGATAGFQITGATAGTNYDQITAGGGVALGSAALSLSFGSYVPPGGTVFTLINKTSAGAMVGTFSGISQGATALFGGLVLRFSYTGGDGNDFTATVASTRTWDGGGADNNWATASNWVGDVAPAAGDHLVFPAGAPADSLATINNYAQDTVFGSIQFTGAGYSANSASAGFNRVKLLKSLDDNHTGAANTWNVPLLCAAPVAITATGSGDFAVSGAIDNAGFPLVLNCDNAAAAPSLNFSAYITGSGSLTKTGADAVRFTGTQDNYHTGGTTVQQGELQLQRSGFGEPIPGGTLVIAAGASVTSTTADQIIDTVVVTVNAGGIFAPGANETIGGLVLSPSATINSGSSLLTVSGNLTASGSGTAIIQGLVKTAGTAYWTVDSSMVVQVDAAHSGDFVKQGAGWLVLGGNNASGTATVKAGVLEVSGNGSNTSIKLDGGAVTGSGTVRNIVALYGTPGCVIAPGLGIGRLTCSDSYALSLDNGVTLAIEIGGTSPGVSHDQLRISGSGSLLSGYYGAARLAVTFTGGFVPAVGDQFVIVDKTTTGTVYSYFEGLQEGQRFSVGPALMQITYSGGTGGNDVVLTCVGLPAQPLRVWDGGGGDGNWATAANWLGDEVPAAGDDIEFPTPLTGSLVTTNNLPADTVFHSISIWGNNGVSTVSFSGNPVTLTGGITNSVFMDNVPVWEVPLTLGADVVFENKGRPFDINSNIALGGHTATFRTGTYYLDYGGVISGTGAIVKDGAGTVRFNGTLPNTYFGGATVSAGTLELSRSGATCITGPLAIGNGATNTTVTGNGELAAATTVTLMAKGGLVAGTDTIASLTTAGGGVGCTNLTIAGDVTVTAGTPSINGILTLGGSSGAIHQIDVAAGATLALNTVSQAASGMKLRKSGAGKLSLNGTTTVGEAVLAGGILHAEATSPGLPVKLDAADSLLSGHGGVGTITAAGGGTVAPGASPGDFTTSNIALNSASKFSVEINGATAGTQYDQLVVTGTVDPGGAALVWSLGGGFLPMPGQEFILIANDGTDPITGTFAGLPEGAVFTVAGGLKLQATYQGGSGNDFVLKTLPVTATGVTRVWDQDSDTDNSWTNPVNWVGDVAPLPGDALVFPDTVLNWSTASNNFAAGTTFASIRVTGTSGHNYALTGNRIKLLNGIQADGLPSVRTIKTPLTLGADQTFSFSNNTYFWFTEEATIDLAGHTLTILNTVPAGSHLSFSGVISGAGGIIHEGTAATSFYSSNTYAGDTVCRSGGIDAPISGAVPGNFFLGGGATVVTADSANLVLADSATLTILTNGTYTCTTSDIIGNLVVDGGAIAFNYSGNLGINGDITINGTTPVNINSPSSCQISLRGAVNSVRNLHVAAGGLLTVPNNVKFSSLSAGTILNKTGAGRAELRASHTVAGITCSNGELVLTGGYNGAVPITLNGGTVSGNMTIGAVTAAAPGGILSPGLAGPGWFNSGNTAFNTATTFVVEIGGTASVTGYDRLQVTGTVNLANATLQAGLVNGYTPAGPHSYTIVENDGADPVNGAFAGLPEGGQFIMGGQIWHVTYHGGDGNDVALSAGGPLPPPVLSHVTVLPVGGGGPNGDAVFSGTATGALPGSLARLEASSTMVEGDWTPLATVVCDDTGTAIFNNVIDPATGADPEAGLRRFYRVAIITP